MSKAKVKHTPLPQDSIVDLIYDRSLKWGEKYGLTPKGFEKKKKTVSEKAAKLDSLLVGASLGCKEKYIREIVEEITGEKLPVREDLPHRIIFDYGIILRILSDPSSKGLPVGETVLVIDSDGAALTTTGSIVELSTGFIKAFQLPTKEDVLCFLSNISDDNNNKLFLSAHFLREMKKK